jgi:probable phosphoglycerate mutase
LVRHGQTDFNLQGIVQGCGVNASINARGRSQAQAFFETYQHIRFDRIYTSELVRSQESVEGFLKKNIPWQPMKALNEISWGYREGQRITPEEDVYYRSVLRQWQEGKTAIPIEGGQSPEEVALQQQPFLALIKSRKEDQNILVCMHGRAMRILLCQMLNYPLRSMDMFEHENLGLYLLNHNGATFTVESYNDTRHLQHMTYPSGTEKG